MKEPPNGEWTLLSSQITDKTGRITYKVMSKHCRIFKFSSILCQLVVQIPSKDKLGYGVYPVNMVVRGDHTVLGTKL